MSIDIYGKSFQEAILRVLEREGVFIRLPKPQGSEARHVEVVSEPNAIFD